MIGSTMMASTSPPSISERPKGPSPPNSGIQLKYLLSQTEKSRTGSTKTMTPQRPNTTLGTAASRSIRKPSVVATRWCA